MQQAPPTDAPKQEIEAYVAGHLWVVTHEFIGCPFLVGQVMRVTRASRLGPAGGKRLCITPAFLSPNDERFAGTFALVKPFLKRYINESKPRIGCSGNIILEVHHARQEDRPDPGQRPGPDRKVDVHPEDAGSR